MPTSTGQRHRRQHSTNSGRWPGRVIRALTPIVAATGIALLGVGGLVALTARSEPAMVPQAPPVEARIADPLAISLDQWVDPDNVVNPCPCVLADLAALPAGWTGETIATGFDLSANGYRQIVALSHPDRTASVLTLQSPTVDAPSEPVDAAAEVVTIGQDADARVSAGLLKWKPNEALQASLTISDVADTETIVELARNLEFVTTQQLPTRGSPESSPPRYPADAELAGTINEHRWQLDVGPSTAISVNLAVDGAGIDAFSRDSGDPPSGNTIDISIAAIGHDTILYGRTPPATAGLVVELADGPNVTLPVFRRDTDTVFGVPIPSGLAITGLTFTDDTGTVIHRIQVPELPTPVLSIGLSPQAFPNPAGQPLI